MRRTWRSCWRGTREGRLRPHVSGTFPLARYREALDVVMNRKARGKVVLVLD